MKKVIIVVCLLCLIGMKKSPTGIKATQRVLRKITRMRQELYPEKDGGIIKISEKTCIKITLYGIDICCEYSGKQIYLRDEEAMKLNEVLCKLYGIKGDR